MTKTHAALGLTLALLVATDAGAISDIFKQVKDSVVVLETAEQALSPTGTREFVTVGGLGSGVLVDPSGIILTAVAASLFSAPYYAAEQLGFHKVTESSFMMASMIDGEPDADDVSKYFRALRRAQAAIDLRPEQHTSHYMKELPERFHDTVDVRRFGPGERIVFEPYTEQMFETSQRWIAEHGIFPDADFGSYDYEQATISIGG